MVETPSRGLLDTSAFLRLFAGADPTSFPVESVLSAITLAELAVGPVVAASESERQARQVEHRAAQTDFEHLPFDDAAAGAFAGVAYSMRRAGRKPTTRTFDGLIAAVAIVHGLPLYTANPRDFEGIDGLTVIALPPVADNDTDVQPGAPADSNQPSPDS